METHEKIRQQLLARREQLLAKLARIHSKSRRSDAPLTADFAEQAVERQNDEVLSALEQAGERELAQINRALARIEAGEYGICRECGQEIPEGRLEVLPFSDLCVACAERLSGGKRP